jgi:hypothetical protein
VDFKEIICGSGFTWLKRSEWWEIVNTAISHRIQ